MKPTEIAIQTMPATPYQPSLDTGLDIKQLPDNEQYFKSTILPKKSKVATRFDSAIHQELRKPLTRINLSLEVLKSEIKDQDLNTYLDIIMRSSLQINKIIDELFKYQPTEGKRKR